MSLIPLLTAPAVIQLHVAFASVALITGPFALFVRLTRGRHRIVGYVWVVAMLGLALSALLIPSRGMAMAGSVGPLHLLAVLTIWSMWRAVTLARAGRIADHARVMTLTWFGGMGIAGLMNFLPGRTINRMVFGAPSDAGYIVIASGLVLLLTLWRRNQRAVPRRGKRTGRTIGA